MKASISEEAGSPQTRDLRAPPRTPGLLTARADVTGWSRALAYGCCCLPDALRQPTAGLGETVRPTSLG